MLSSQQPPRLRARIDEAGLLRVTGLPAHPAGLEADHDEPENAYAELINLVLDHAVQIGGEVWLHATTPSGIWGMSVHPDSTTIPIPLEVFDTPDPQPVTAPLDLEAALAAAGELTPPPADVVLALAADPAPGVRAAATAELSRWGDDPDVVVSADLDPEQLAALADCRLGWVRAGVAGHPRTEHLALERLAKDPDPLVVQALACRLDLPAQLATALAKHPHDLVRAELGRNPTATFLLAGSSSGGAWDAGQAAPPPGTGRAAETITAGVAVLDGPTSGPPARGDPGPTSRTPATTDQRASDPHPRRRWLAGGLVASLLLLGGAAATWRAADADAPAPSTSSTVAWQGTWLPVGPEGPADPTSPTASGFSHTERGAALAAAHLSVRIDPYAGPAVYGHTISSQTFGGDPAGLLAQTDAAYRAAATRAGITDDQPIPTSPGRIVGWRSDGWTSDGPVTVHLLVTTPDGQQVDFAIAVAWVDGDYRLVDPTRGDTFVTTTDPDPDTYNRF